MALHGLSQARGHKLVGFPGPQRWVLIDLLDGGRRPVGVTVGADGGLGLLLNVAGGRGRSLAAHAGGVHRLGGDKIQVLVIGDLV